MDKNRFWKIIDASRKRAKGDLEPQAESLREQLEALTPDEIVHFRKHFDEYWGRAYRWDLWGAAYIIAGGCSDDAFMDFRAWLISKGEKVYEDALKNPDSLVKSIKEEDEECECQFEEFTYIPSKAWEEKTGKGTEDFPVHYTWSQVEGPAGEKWSEDDPPRLFPKLWKRFGGD